MWGGEGVLDRDSAVTMRGCKENINEKQRGGVNNK